MRPAQTQHATTHRNGAPQRALIGDFLRSPVESTRSSLSTNPDKTACLWSPSCDQSPLAPSHTQELDLHGLQVSSWKVPPWWGEIPSVRADARNFYSCPEWSKAHRFVDMNRLVKCSDLHEVHHIRRASSSSSSTRYMQWNAA